MATRNRKGIVSRGESQNNVVRRNYLFANLKIFIVSLCLSLIIAELALRLMVPLDTGTSFQFRIPHPVLGWVLEPGASYSNRMPEATVHVTYNTGGWRDVEHTVEKPEGVFRILILGDSFMEAYSVDLEDSFSRQIEKFARTSGYDVEVINLGVGGYGTLQEYLAFREIGRQYKPDLVLLGFYAANDVRNNSFELESILETDQMKTDSRPFLDMDEATAWKISTLDFEGAQRRYVAATAYRNTLEYKLKEWSVLLRLVTSTEFKRHITSLVLGNQASKLEQNRENEPEPINEKRRDLAIRGVNYCAEPPEYTKAWKVTERILARLRDEADAIGSEFVVFTVPAYDEVNVQHMKQVAIDWVCLEEAPGYTRLSLILTRLDVDLINLLPEFRRVSREDGIELFRPSDSHWNPEGHALAGERVVSELIKRGYFLNAAN